jgi:hypothetical protein
MNNLIAGFLQEAGSAKLIDLFLWSDMTGLVDARFQQRTHEGVVILNLSIGPNTLFRGFSQTRRNDIRRAIKSAVSVDFAKSRDDVSAYYAVSVDWTRSRSLPITEEEQFQRIFEPERPGSCFWRAIMAKSSPGSCPDSFRKAWWRWRRAAPFEGRFT